MAIFFADRSKNRFALTKRCAPMNLEKCVLTDCSYYNNTAYAKLDLTAVLALLASANS